MGLHRRTFLKIGMSGAAMLALGGVGLGLRSSVLVVPSGPLHCLTARQYSIFAAIADCMISPTDEMPQIQELGVVEQIDEMLRHVHPDDRTQILQVLSLLENALAGFLLDGRFQTFTATSRQARVRILEGWRTSRLSVKQQAFVALHGLCVAAYWGNPKAYIFAGYSGPPDFSSMGLGAPADE